MLPDVIKQTGVTTRKRAPDILMSVNLISPDGRYDQLYLSNYALMQIRDELLRLQGISDIFITGQRDYSMRIWVDPEKLASRNLTAGDVVAAVREQNARWPAGRSASSRCRRGRRRRSRLTTLGRLKDPEQFADIILRSHARRPHHPDPRRGPRGTGGQERGRELPLRRPGVGGADHLPVARRQRPGGGRRHPRENGGAGQELPRRHEYNIRYDTTPYTRQCIEEVVKALRDAIILVALVVLLFLQNWRSAMIPLIAVPVAIIGTFAVMAVMGFSLNNLTLFGLVLAIGIVVDDAIVVVEAVEHHIENGLPPREATIKAMSQVSGPVIAVGLVLSAVFVPCAFISGITGQFFRQFALTIAASTIISAFNS